MKTKSGRFGRLMLLVLLCAAMVCTVLKPLPAAAMQAEEEAPATEDATEPGSDSEAMTATSQEDFEYSITSGKTVVISQYIGAGNEVVIPSEIEGYPVTEIGKKAFSYKKLKSLFIPESVRTIDESAFEYVKITDSFSLPQGVTIGNCAFNYAELPVAVTIPADAVLSSRSFEYSKGLEFLHIASGAQIAADAFSYSKNLAFVVCDEGVQLADLAFHHCSSLEQAVLYIDLEFTGDPFNGCDGAEILYAQEPIFSEMLAQLQDAFSNPDSRSVKKYTVKDMSFTASASMEKSSMPTYDLYMINAYEGYAVGAAVYPASVLDLENDKDIQVMLNAAREMVPVEDYYKVRVCGLPGVWFNIYDEDSASVGVYLYIAGEDHLYYLMFLNMQNSRDVFFDIAASIAIKNVEGDTDLSAVPR